LGIGDQHVIPITVDEKARQDIEGMIKIPQNFCYLSFIKATV